MKKIYCLLTYFLLGLCITGITQPGSLDLTFSQDGKTTAGFMLSSANAQNAGQSVAIQADGKIVVAGWVENSDGTTDFTVFRYNSTGTLDNTFDLDGKQITDFGNSANAHAVAIQADGKIVAAGSTYDGTADDFALVRYNTDGTLDNSFSGDGKLTTGFGGEDVAQALAIQADGKIVTAGYIHQGSIRDFAIARYNTDGTLDKTFSGDGKLTTDFGHSDDAYAVAIQGDGKIVVAGAAGSDFAIVRYNSGGTLDNSFNDDGKLTTDFGSPNDIGNSVALQPDGKIVVAGASNKASDFDFTIARYNSNGMLDKTFNGDGKLTTDFGGNERAHSVAIQSDGKIVAVGFTDNNVIFNYAISRYTANGILDNTFSDDGKLITDFSGLAYSAAIQANGKIVVAGEHSIGSSDCLVARYNSDGELDNSFASDGYIITDVGLPEPSNDNAKTIIVNANGKIIVVGNSSTLGTDVKKDLAIVQYKPNGTSDNNFGFKGQVLGEFEGGNFTGTTAIIDQNDKILVGGYFDHGKTDFALARYNANGTLDKTFSDDGFLTTSISIDGRDRVWELAIQPDGKILAAGDSRSCTTCTPDFALTRYNDDGTSDNFFSLDGKLTTDFAADDDQARSIALQADGKILVAGYTKSNTGYDIGVVRYKTDGDLDNTFSGDGKQTTDFNGNDDYGVSMKIQSNGKILVGGRSGKTSVKDFDFALVRYNVNGTLDNTFSGDGKQTTAIDGTSEDDCQSITLQADGKIIAGGSYLTTTRKNDFALVRYLSNGAPDNTFGTNGIVATDFGNTDDFARSITIDKDSKLLAAGASDNDFAVARYNLTNGTIIAKATKISKPELPFLLKAYPNPFSYSTNISYTLPGKYSSAKIIITNQSGMVLKAENISGTGKGSLNIDASVLMPGIYNYTLYVDGKLVDTQQMILTK